MNTKKLGVIFLIIGIVVTLILISMVTGLYQSSNELGCFQNENCSRIESSLSIVHIAFGVVGFILALGIYILIFYKGEESILKRLEETKNNDVSKEKFNIMLKMLDDNEKKVLKAIKEQDGIQQSTLVIRTGLSRSKVSEILKGFEAKNLIKRKNKGRTMSVFLTEKI